MKTVKMLCATIVLAGAALANNNAAAAEWVTETRVVSYADLNLSEPAGVEALYRRIRAAARDVCGVNRDMSPLFLNVKRECVRNSLAAAVAKVSNYQLTEYYSQTTGNNGRMRVASTR